MISGNNTSPEWQVHTSDVIVLPVGSMEQHAAHLPLNTDSIHAEYSAGIIAEHFDWALLPAIQIANSFEHSGFRGSFSLRPETLMQIIRDLADEAEMQNFRIMVVVNGHGGNFALGPVIRDINRQDRKLKIILISSWTGCPPGITDASKYGKDDLHAGENETSGMLYAAPDSVRPLDAGQPPVEWDIPFRQSDLNTFGVGHCHPGGNVGDYQLATAEKGRDMCERALTPLFRFLEDRVKRLREQPVYAGSGGLAIRKIVHSDMPDLLDLVEQVNWNQLPRDWDNFLELAPDTSLAMVRLGKVLGTAASIKYKDQLAWIGMVIVDQTARRMGIASRLMNAVIELSADCDTIKLDATPDGRRVYRKLGFADEYGLSRLTGNGWSGAASDKSINSFKQDDFVDVISFDRVSFGVERKELLNRMLTDSPEFAKVARKDGKLTGFCLARTGREYTQIGPVEAIDTETAFNLVSAVVQELPGQPLIIDVLDDNTEFVDKLKKHGFISRRSLTRMYRGSNKNPGKKQQYFAIAAYELG